jgi:hypothetical protein
MVASLVGKVVAWMVVMLAQIRPILDLLGLGSTGEVVLVRSWLQEMGCTSPVISGGSRWRLNGEILS